MTLRRWTTRISKWAPWKKALLGVAGYLMVLTAYTILTFDKGAPPQ